MSGCAPVLEIGGVDQDLEVAPTPVVLDITNAQTVVEVLDSPIALDVTPIQVVVEIGQGVAGIQGIQGIPGTGILPADVREDEQLVGAINGVNKVYVLPNGDLAEVADPGLKIKVWYNGKRLHEGGANDYTTSESGGAGTGFDTVTFTAARPAPKVGDIVTADYVLEQ